MSDLFSIKYGWVEVNRVSRMLQRHVLNYHRQPRELRVMDVSCARRHTSQLNDERVFFDLGDPHIFPNCLEKSHLRHRFLMSKILLSRNNIRLQDCL